MEVFEWAKTMETPDELIEEALRANEDDEVSIVGEAFEQMATDSDDDTWRLLTDYRNASTEQKNAMDAVLVHITGYSLQSLIKKALGYETDI